MVGRFTSGADLLEGIVQEKRGKASKKISRAGVLITLDRRSLLEDLVRVILHPLY